MILRCIPCKSELAIFTLAIACSFKLPQCMDPTGLLRIHYFKNLSFKNLHVLVCVWVLGGFIYVILFKDSCPYNKSNNPLLDVPLRSLWPCIAQIPLFE